MSLSYTQLLHLGEVLFILVFFFSPVSSDHYYSISQVTGKYGGNGYLLSNTQLETYLEYEI